MARGRKKETLTPEERLQAALVPESEQPYPVPGNWCWASLQTIDQYQSSSIDPSKHPDTLFELYSVPSSADNHPEIVMGCEIGSTKQIVKKGDVLLCKINPRINRVWKVSQHTENVLLASSEWIIVRNSKIDSDYLMYCFSAPYFREYMLSNISGVGGSLMRAQPKYVKTYPIPVPPLSEQQRIVDRIESLFAKLDEAKQKAQDALDSFETRKAAILHKAFTGELTAQWRKGNGLGMESWETHELVECFEIVSGIQKTPARSPRDNPIPYLAVANVYRDKIDLSDIRYFEVTPEELEKLKLQDKDILIVEGNGSGNEIGRCAMWHNELPLCIHQNHIIRMRNKTADVLPEYVLSYLNSQAGKSVMQERAKTTAGLFNLSAGKVKTIPLPFASLDEQTEIVRILDNLLAKERQAKEAAEGVLEQIGLIKKAILARAFRGELGTNDPSDESEVLALLQCDS
ncbi:restriction endonuclease subunit S [Anaerotruncus colihominis]|uniref:restriction endonuclease subunit S n=1 Tax=Anaerotruncus colihominis TaxID=169435 RepID=UPI0026EF170A|nr:restriction endonuclease subunit S [Anaerotruncus colihominis]